MTHTHVLRSASSHVGIANLLTCMVVALALGAFSTAASAQVQVLSSAGVDADRVAASEVEFVSARPGVQVHEITGRSTAVAYGSGGSAVAHGLSSNALCETPCRLRLDRPIEFGIAGASAFISPNGNRLRYEVAPMRVGLRVFSYMTLLLGATGALSAGLILPLLEPDYNTQVVRNAMYGVLIGGLVVTALSIVGMIRSRGRFERIEGITF